MTERFVIKQHDLLPHLRVQLLDEDTPVDLLNAAAVHFLMRNRRYGLKINAHAYIHDQHDPDLVGVVSYRWVAGDTNSVGDFNAEFEVTWADGKRQTFPAEQYMTVSIEKDLGDG